MADVLPTSVKADPFVLVRSDANWLKARCESSSLPIVSGARGRSRSMLQRRKGASQRERLEGEERRGSSARTHSPTV